jgi:hypothetical protein
VFLQKKNTNFSHSSFLLGTLFKLQKIKEYSSKEQENLAVPSKEK